MQSKLLIALSAAAATTLVSAADERVLGVYVFHRHGDRTAKAWTPVNLTALGADQAYSSGAFYRKRYVQSDASVRISGVSSDNPALSQLAVTAPLDTVLHNSAVSFLQGMYPPTGQSETLANGTKVEAPLGGYQFIPVNAISDAATANKAENQGWLQGGSGCDKAVQSSNSYLSSPDYQKTYAESLDLYQSILPVINTTYNKDAASFKNGYTSMSPSPNYATDSVVIISMLTFDSLGLHQCCRDSQLLHPVWQPHHQAKF
jgi:hypothetical protein